MSSLCLVGDGVTASLFAAALHFGWTPADGVPAARAIPAALARAGGADRALLAPV